MKKLLVILMVTFLAAPIFALDFSEATFSIDTKFENDIFNQLLEKIEQTNQYNYQIYYPKSLAKIEEMIKQEMKTTLKQIEIVAGLDRKRSWLRRSDIDEQKRQKLIYEQMLKIDNVPHQLSMFIMEHFDLDKINGAMTVSCIHREETKVYVQFTYNSKHGPKLIRVYYDYDHQINNGKIEPIRYTVDSVHRDINGL